MGGGEKTQPIVKFSRMIKRKHFVLRKQRTPMVTPLLNVFTITI